ncbi:MAG: flagellar biosynthesis protein FliQ [Acidobacteriaceae bacterium]|nr:flagellar biosynthesis protein FliQ [Acidobacteriaceae bacterium]MBV9294078.1 flagellar biosynthesis protein FliQ [Acidobacteriaceae bacterium]MBV9764143.1 flagellar biosynthesis protein FliQ [Acidobacteriaceae bacterium]
MDSNAIITILREGLFLVLLLSAAPMLASLVIGLTISMFQAVTQLQEPTLSYVPKVVGVLITIAILGPWMLAQTVRFAQTLFDNIVLAR